MATYERLRRLFTDLTLATLAAHAVACGDDGVHVGPPIDRSRFSESVCGPNEYLSGVKPALAVDYLAIRYRSRDYTLVDASAGTTKVSLSLGTPCGGATDHAACTASLEALSAAPAFDHSEPADIGGLAYQLVWTRGNHAGVVGTRDALLAFLGTIDSAQDAALVAQFVERHSLFCNTPSAQTTDAGVEVLTRTGYACGEGTAEREHILLIAPDGTATVRETVIIAVGSPGCVIGRLTSGLSLDVPASCEGLGAYFAEMAHLEAAAVLAFERLADELEALGAPRDLIDRARMSADDETRHANDIGALARRFGGTARATPHGDALPLRGALEMALENAQEGCVRETYGALVATHQALAAEDAQIRETLGRIAMDETRHAALSWDLAAWFDTQLEAEERKRVSEARRSALRCFERSLDTKLDDTDKRRIGMPDETRARALFEGMTRHLFKAA
jgi:hypothetical protein